MRTFAQNQNQPQERASSSLARSNTETSGLVHHTHTILHLQRTIGNQAVLRLLQGNTSPGLTHEFSRIPVHTNNAASNIQPKLEVNTPGDAYEQEADRVADQVMRMPEPQLQRTCACGGGCPRCGKEQGSYEQLQTKHVQKHNAGEATASPTVEDAISSPGQPLDSTTREFMDSRFGHDFSKVRVHTDAQAAESARAVKALAYTVGWDVVFRTGQYIPYTPDGRWLLAHELVHVVQQTGSHPAGRGSDGATGTNRKVSDKNATLQRRATAEKTPAIMHNPEYSVQASADCDQEQIDCFRRCWRRKPPWPIDKGSSGHYGYCQSKCLAEYMICVGERVVERAFDSMAAAMDWLRRHPEVVVGTIVVVAGVSFIVATGGSGALVLAPLAL